MGLAGMRRVARIAGLSVSRGEAELKALSVLRISLYFDSCMCCGVDQIPTCNRDLSKAAFLGL